MEDSLGRRGPRERMARNTSSGLEPKASTRRHSLSHLAEKIQKANLSMIPTLITVAGRQLIAGASARDYCRIDVLPLVNPDGFEMSLEHR